MTPPRPRVSVVVPSWSGDVRGLADSLRDQTFQDFDLQVVRGVSPAARARNLGVERSTGEIVVFVDDDARLGHSRVLERMVEVLDGQPDVAVVGTSKIPPPDAGWFQRAAARQVPRMVYPVVDTDTESNPPLTAYGFTAITTTCCAVRRDVFAAAGGFDETLTTGEDTDFFYRVRADGGRFVIAGQTWVYHRPPASLRDLVRVSFGYGLGHALEARKDPERGMNLLRLDKPWGKALLVLAIPAFPVALFTHLYFDPHRRPAVGFRPLKTISTYAVVYGYAYGWFHGPPQSAGRTYRGRKPAAEPGVEVVERGR